MSFLHANLSHFKQDLEELLTTFTPHSKRIYIVGGAVRDILLGVQPKELDIEIYDINPEQFEILAKQLDAKGVGKSFFVYKWKNFDLSLPRIESKISPTHQGFRVALCNDEKKASFRRDFTMNALMLNVLNGEILDFWGGIKDIERKIVRYIDKKKFCEDSLRALRGIQFASRFGFIIEKNTLHVMKNLDISNLSKTRVFWELEKLFNALYPEIGLLLGYKIDLWKKIFAIEFDFDSLFMVAQEIKIMKQYALKHLEIYIFLYVFINRLKLDMKKILILLEAPKRYYTILTNSPYLKLPLSDKELLELSIDLPLKNWVGICQKDLEARAKELHIYENKFSGGVTAQEIIKEGFKGKDIAQMIRERKLEKIEKLTCKKSALTK